MVEERTNISGGGSDVEDGVYELTVVGKPGKFATAKSHYRLWKFGLVLEGKPKTITILLFPWESEELLLALGGKKDGKDTIWDPDKVDKKRIKAEIVHEADNNNKMRMKIKRAKALKSGSKTEEEEPAETTGGESTDEEVPF